MNGHGPDKATYDRAICAELVPQRIEGAMAFMFETRLVIRQTDWALQASTAQPDYDVVWAGFAKARLGA